jgi:hypothetical protein
VRGEHRGGDFTWIGKVDTDAGEQAVVITFGEDDKVIVLAAE